MNTSIYGTPKEVFQTKEAYLKFVENWKKITNSDEKYNLKCEHHVLYAILRNKDWRKCFTPCTNKNKLNNGMKPYTSAFNCMIKILSTSDNTVRNLLAPFKDSLTKELLAIIQMWILYPISDFSFGKKLPSQPYKPIQSIPVYTPPEKKSNPLITWLGAHLQSGLK
jgi:hypothetical protein